MDLISYTFFLPIPLTDFSILNKPLSMLMISRPTICQEMGMWGGNYNRSLIGMKGGKIKFDYGMKTIKFANDVDEAEARMIIEKLKGNTNLKEENFA